MSKHKSPTVKDELVKWCENNICSYSPWHKLPVYFLLDIQEAFVARGRQSTFLEEAKHGQA